MFRAGNIPLLADDLDVLMELKNQLEINGILRFKTFKRLTDNIQFNCPIHHDGQEKRPSCGITTRDKPRTKAGTVHCFSCGYTATLEEMISHLFGYDDFGNFGKQWLLKNFASMEIEDRELLTFDTDRNKVHQQSYVTDDELDKYRYYHPYMFQRKLTPEVIEKFDIGYDKDTNSITFPVRDEKGNCLFVGRRSVDKKMFNYPQGVDKPVYGLYELPKDCDEVIVCESMFNALTCYVYGKPAVALLGTGTTEQFEQLKRLNCRKLILGLDPDEAGEKASTKIKNHIQNCKILTKLVIPIGKDINNLTLEEFRNLQEIYF